MYPLDPIVVVDDEELVRTILVRMLREAGYQALAADGGEAALALIAERGGAVALVLSDVVMPKLDGLALVARLSVAHPTLPTILMTAYTDGELAEHNLVPTCGLLRKPFTSAALLAEVRRCLDARGAA